MVQKLTLEDEISQRRCRAQHTIDLICTLRKRVEQLVERYNQHTSSSSENSVKLLTLLLTELKENAEEAVASAAQNIRESEGHLLPALCQDPGKLILSAIEQLRTSDLEDLVSENFSAQEAKGLIAVPCAQASVPASSAHPDPIAALISYLQPLQLYINPTLKAQASDILTQLLSEPDVAGWIFSGKGHKGDFNKTKVFKLARMLRVHHFYLDNFLDKDLDQILEHSDSDTNFRKNMNKEYHNDLVIEKHLKRIIEPLLKKS